MLKNLNYSTLKNDKMRFVLVIMISGSVLVRNMFISSAYAKHVASSVIEKMSLIHSINKSGPSILPCATPESVFSVVDVAELWET